MCNVGWAYLFGAMRSCACVLRVVVHSCPWSLRACVRVCVCVVSAYVCTCVCCVEWTVWSVYVCVCGVSTLWPSVKDNDITHKTCEDQGIVKSEIERERGVWMWISSVHSQFCMRESVWSSVMLCTHVYVTYLCSVCHVCCMHVVCMHVECHQVSICVITCQHMSPVPQAVFEKSSWTNCEHTGACLCVWKYMCLRCACE